MFVSKHLKQNNIAEYLIYMWQVEDLIRANGCDMENIKCRVIDCYPSLSKEQSDELSQWYEDLIEMMRREEVMQKGHLQINKNVITWLTDLHLQLLASSKFPYYSAAYYKALPFIVELRAKGANKEEPELETCIETSKEGGRRRDQKGARGYNNIVVHAFHILYTRQERRT